MPAQPTDWQLILELARLSERSYSESTIFSPQTNAHCLVEEDDASIRIAFRGTKDVSDFIRDAEFWQARTWGGRIHAGFNRDLGSIAAPLIADVKSRLGRKQKPLYFTGHSLGGGIATPAAELFFRQSVGTVAKVVTFGQPRTFNLWAAHAYNRLLGDRTIRVVNERDIIPHVPLFGLIFWYWHHHSEILLRHDIGQVVMYRSLAGKIVRDGGKTMKAKAVLRDANLWDSVKIHHGISTYRAKIQAVASNPDFSPSRRKIFY